MRPLYSFQFTILLVVVTSLILAPTVYAALGVSHLRCEYKTNPIGIDVEKPRLSWIIESDKPGTLQSAYELRCAATEKDVKAGKNLLWSTGKVLSDQSIHVEYAGPVLQSREFVYWQVRVWDNNGKRSRWSEPAFWEMGLLDDSDWQAQWIHPDIEEDISTSSPAQMLRKEFSVSDQVVKARIYATSLGLYELELNGQRVGDQVFTPGWTAYEDRIQYQVYDVTSLLQQGENAIGATLGDGWYRGNIGFRGQRNAYGDKLALLVQLHVDYANGTSDVIISDTSWRASTGPILASDIYNGEIYDARLEKDGWSTAGYDDSDWVDVLVLPKPQAKIIASQGAPIKKIEEITPVEILQTPQGDMVIDMGQNMVGWIRLTVQGPAGTTVTIRHAEVLDKDGNFYTENLRAAKQTNSYTLKGEGIEVYEPHFTFQGFRYIDINGWPGEPSLDAIKGIVVHSDIAVSGTFECSNSMINQLQQNIKWGQKGNFVDVPTDCPQRDERLGWTGDAQVFARTACFNHDVAAFYTKWLKDFTADQQAEGQIPHVIPDVLSIASNRQGNSASAGWADAAVIVPWTVYLCYGDMRVLEEQYPCMQGWVEYMAKRAGDTWFWNTDFTFGDWLSFNTTRSDYPGATTDKDFITQAYFIYSTDLLYKIAQLLGKSSDAAKYARMVERAKAVFMDEFVTPNGRLSPNTQTAYALALGFNLLPPDVAAKAARRLTDDVNKFKHITTGFLGTPLICHVLSDYGYFDEAFMLLNRTEYPSWLYPITQGATTIWERWDGQKPDGTFQNAGMNSFNHYAYGAIGEWLYRVVAGLEIDEHNPGYKHTIIQPHPGGQLTSAKASVRSMYGTVASAWSINESAMQLEVIIPANTTASVLLPHATVDKVLVNKKDFGKADGITSFSQDGDKVVVEIGSGTFQFSYEME
ncbi:alpha-L-rhamnosidase [candidate division KSB1 bacterium]|nr:family 78 glycoside hydrolase catalytic domain [candidate division KSB1 bacterium]RQW05000.1 MAG: alpha-L-rhamnosidase [candidate division KSB1 bacterium]